MLGVVLGHGGKGIKGDARGHLRGGGPSQCTGLSLFYV